MDASDSRWKLELDSDCRPKQLARILVTLKTCFPNCASLDSDELVKMSKWLEEENYDDATSYVDYLHRVYVRVLRMERRFQTTAAYPGMQSQLHNQGQQLLSQNVQNTIVSDGAQRSASLAPALPSMTSVPNAAGQGQGMNMQSGIAQNFVGSSVSQGFPSNIFSNTQWQMPEWDPLQQFSSQEQQQLQHQLMKQNLLQPTQMSNVVGRSTNTQSETTHAQYLFQQQQEQLLQQLRKKNLLQPTQMSNVVGRSTNTQSEIAHAQDLFQQQQHQLMNPQLFSSSMNSNAQTGQNASMNSNAQTEQNADDWKEEIYQKIQAMKQSFLPYLNEIYQKTLKECQQLKRNVSVSNVPQCERQKLLDLLEKHIQILNMSKDGIGPVMKGNLSNYEKQVMHVIKSNWPLEPVSAQQQIQQPGGHSLSTQPQQQPQQQQQQQQQQEEEVDNQPDATNEIIDVIADSD